MKKLLILASLVAAFAVANPYSASAQGPLTYSGYGSGGNTAVGYMAGVYNTQDSVLYDGELVMADTSTVAKGNLRRIGVKRFDGTALGRLRVLGVLVGNVAKSSQRGVGRVLVWGYHPAMYVGLSDLAANRPIKIGIINGMFQGADTLTATVGYAISRSSASTSTVNTGPRYRYKGYFFGNHGVGATL